jgi:hypothetical protein
MNKLALSALALLSLFTVSCNRYQINVLSSTNSVKDEQSGTFNVENDSVKITYSFYGEKAPVSIKIFNKLDKPIYVDWNRSAAIVDGKAISYTNKDIAINAGVNAVSDSYKLSNSRNSILPNTVSYTSASIAGVATLPQNTTFLPPHSETNNVPLSLSAAPVRLEDTTLKAEQLVYSGEYTARKVNVQSASFTKEHSPFVFKSYLTLYVTEGNVTKPMAFENEFYVSKLIATTHDPLLFSDFKNPRGDYFIFTEKYGQ